MTQQDIGTWERTHSVQDSDTDTETNSDSDILGRLIRWIAAQVDEWAERRVKD